MIVEAACRLNNHYYKNTKVEFLNCLTNDDKGLMKKINIFERSLKLIGVNRVFIL